ncbi:hypothetical protein LPJ61_006287 [Coemansia biformis]|uniref:Uncharacterized protein n=1 Tax=Coemansia biformis TaxID=1286918 RepID=A0A9W8CQ77_9FUNG|nr:hypothetical protein LPJ61_006287 [Coemansia biformis]
MSDVDALRRDTLDPITKLAGSESWVSEQLVRALAARYPVALATTAPALLWMLLLNGGDGTASLVVAHTGMRLDMLEGRFARGLVARRPELSLLEWLSGNGFPFGSTHSACVDTAQLIGWVVASHIEPLRFLAQKGVLLPVRTLVEYAVGHAAPEVVGLLVEHSADHASPLAWSDVLVMACTDGTTRLDVFRFIVRRTEPGLVWSFAASCLAAHAVTDGCAFDKFSTLRDMPRAAEWIVKPIHGRTPIERLCDRLTFENLAHLSPFIREYIELGVPAANMPRVLSGLCK